METIASDGTPLAAYLEGRECSAQAAHVLIPHDRQLTNATGEGHLGSTLGDTDDNKAFDYVHDHQQTAPPSFAPSTSLTTRSILRRTLPTPAYAHETPPGTISRLHNAWSTSLNSRIGRADNARFIEHFRYIIVASQLLNEYLDQGSIPPSQVSRHGLDGAVDRSVLPGVTTSLYGAAATAIVAFALVYLIHWARSSHNGVISKSRVAFVVAVLITAALLGYGYIRRQWLQFLRRSAVAEVTALTANWQALEVSASAALSLIQEVELVTKGYRLSTPLPPASRLEDQASSRRCGHLRRVLCKAYTAVIPLCIESCSSFRTLVDEDDLEKYFEVYDISTQDVKEASGEDALTVLEDDAESLKSLRVLSSRLSILRRVTLCSLMALEADGGKPDFYRWRLAIDIMSNVSKAVGASAEKLQQCMSEMETVATPITPAPSRFPNVSAKEKIRGQVRKISMLSSGIRGLQAKMQILREETSRSIEQSEDLADLGPNLMAQYESIGVDLRELMQAWEAGKASLQSNLTKHERRISLASSIARSPVSSLGGLTAVEEGGGPADALKALTGGSISNRSSMGTTPSDEEVFEAVALPRQRSIMTREERIHKMQEERERQSMLRAKRDANTSMMRELESVINLKKTGASRITSI